MGCLAPSKGREVEHLGLKTSSKWVVFWARELVTYNGNFSSLVPGVLGATCEG